MPWTNKIRAVVTLRDIDLGVGRFTRPLAGGYKSGMFRPTANIEGYLTSALVETSEADTIELGIPTLSTLTFASGNFELSVGDEFFLQMGDRKIGKSKVTEVLDSLFQD